jgi:hypothetical protein
MAAAVIAGARRSSLPLSAHDGTCPQGEPYIVHPLASITGSHTVVSPHSQARPECKLRYHRVFNSILCVLST